jgi:methylated-DNA-protein-cysteine methyltransferase-like protein
MNKKFKDEVYELVSRIPEGKVMTYGQISALCGHPCASRVVGQIAHFGPDYLPWHRVVNYRGSMASGYPLNGRDGQARLLNKEGVVVRNCRVDLEEYQWSPVK